MRASGGTTPVRARCRAEPTWRENGAGIALGRRARDASAPKSRGRRNHPFGLFNPPPRPRATSQPRRAAMLSAPGLDDGLPTGGTMLTELPEEPDLPSEQLHTGTTNAGASKGGVPRLFSPRDGRRARPSTAPAKRYSPRAGGKWSRGGAITRSGLVSHPSLKSRALASWQSRSFRHLPPARLLWIRPPRPRT